MVVTVGRCCNTEALCGVPVALLNRARYVGALSSLSLGEFSGAVRLTVAVSSGAAVPASFAVGFVVVVVVVSSALIPKRWLGLILNSRGLLCPPLLSSRPLGRCICRRR